MWFSSSGRQTPRSTRRRGRRLADGHLVDDEGTQGGRRQVHRFRLAVVAIGVFFLFSTNPANQPYLKRFKRLWNTRTSSVERSSERLQSNWSDAIDRLQSAYNVLTKEAADSDKLPVDDTVINYGLFSVRETKGRRLEVMGANRIFKCRVTTASSSYHCRVLRDTLLPTSPLRRNNKQQEQLEQLLVLDPLHQRRYFQAYRILLLIVFGALLLTFCITQDGDDDPSSAAVRDALTRGFWPNPYIPISSTIVTICDLWLIVAPALAIMDDLVLNQNKQSIFRLTKDHYDINYAFAVSFFLLAASLSNLVLLNWTNVTSSSSSLRHRPVPSLGYHSDVWAACALGYLRACRDQHFSLAFLDWQIPVSAAVWIRAALQLTVVIPQFSLSAIGLWLAADAIGYWIGMYQIQHHFVLSMITNAWDGVDQFFTSLLGPAW